MEAVETNPIAVKRPTVTPKAILSLKYGSKACYKIEEVLVEKTLPGLVIPQQGRILYRCCLELPEFSVTSDTFTRKRDAEQSAANMALEKLGIESTENNPSPLEALDELVVRVSSLFTDKFLSSSHPLVGHFRAAIEREGDHLGLIPASIIAACDVKLNNLCKTINPKAEFDPVMVISLIMEAARSTGTLHISDGELWIGKQDPYSPEILQSLTNQYSTSTEHMLVEALHVPCSIENPVEPLTLDISPGEYYIDEIARKLGAGEASRVLVSRTVGKASSEMRLYYCAPKVPLLSSDSSVEILPISKENINLKTIFNERASYLSGQNIHGDAILATVGYTWKARDLFHEDVSLCTYYRILLGRSPDGNYKLFRDAILAAELPNAFTTRSNWRGPSPKDLLCMFCRHHRLSEPLFSVKDVSSSEASSEILDIYEQLKTSKTTEDIECVNGIAGDAIDGESDRQYSFNCEVKILSKGCDVIIEYLGDAYKKPTDAVQNAALKVLSWFDRYFKQSDMHTEFSSFGDAHNFRVYPQILSQEFASFLAVHGIQKRSFIRKCSSLASSFKDQSNIKQENEMSLFNIEGPDSGISPSSGFLVCISYTVSLMRKEGHVEETLESKEEFEFEIGTGAVINQLEACVTQMSMNQTARFIVEPPSRDLILVAAGNTVKGLSQLSLQDCFLEYSFKVLRIMEPSEDRMEQALFSPPLSKQRVEFAVGHINNSCATSLVDFGCGSGSLLDSLLEHSTSLEKIVGVDISRKSLSRAAKILHSKLDINSDHITQKTRSAVLYDGSITDFDSRLYGFDIGTCLEVIEHMQEDQAHLFGDVVLAKFCPRLLIVSTPNYEYNPILQRSNLSNKEDDPEEKSQALPCKFRNHDHKFEWTRKQFECWANELASRHGYSVEFSGVGGSGEEPGFASQIVVFRRSTSHQAEKCSVGGDSPQPYEVIWEWPSMSRSSL